MGQDRSILGSPTRRAVLIGAALVGGALIVGTIPVLARTAKEKDFGAFGPFLKITSDGTVIVISKHSEMGQGAHSGLAALVAEELDADWTAVKVEMAPADAAVYGHTQINFQITGGSSSISNSWDQLRRTGAAARAMFVRAAAALGGVPEAEIAVRDGIVAHAPSGKSAGFGALLALAAKIPPPADPGLKQPQDFRLIGTDKVTRLDARAKSTGGERFTQDVHLPDMLTAVVAHAPRFGGKVKSFDASAVKTVSGVVAVFEIPSGVAVVARNTYAALKGREQLTVDWDDSAAEMRSSAEILAAHRAIAEGKAAAEWFPFETKGDVASAFAGAAGTMVYGYDFPYLAHAAMEPMNCVAQVDGTRVRLTFGAQSQTPDQWNIAAIVGGAPEEVEIVTLPSGGSFGRRSATVSDYQTESVHIARKIGGFRPVKLVWTREDDMAGGSYRAVAHHRVEVEVDEVGYPLAWRHRIVSASILAGSPFASRVKNGVDHTVVEGVRHSPYFDAIPVIDAQVHSPPSSIRVLWLRSVGATHTAMAMEHTIDQLARRAGIDPVAYRRAMFVRAGKERHLRVLELAAEKAGWGTPLEDGWTRGVAIHECFGSVVANVVEVRLENGEPRVRRVVAAIDCGIAVAPDQVRAQMEGGVNYGLSYSLFGEVKIEGGIVQNTNFDSYRVLRMNEAPLVETYIVPSVNVPSGVGEPGTPVVGPAVANALLALTGKATDSLPFVKA